NGQDPRPVPRGRAPQARRRRKRKSAISLGRRSGVRGQCEVVGQDASLPVLRQAQHEGSWGRALPLGVAISSMLLIKRCAHGQHSTPSSSANALAAQPPCRSANAICQRQGPHPELVEGSDGAYPVSTYSILVSTSRRIS